MGSISVRPVDDQRALKQFLKLPWSIYRGDPHWVPPILADRKKILDRTKNPFWKHAERELFLAYRDGEPVGRIAAIINHEHDRIHGERAGFFGFFESVDDQRVADALFGAATEWLQGEGAEFIRGPASPSVNDEFGLLVEGFEDPPQVLMPYNPKYYIRLIESAGLTREVDLYAWLLKPGFISPKLERVQSAVREREGLKIRSFRFSPKNAFREDVAHLRKIYNEAWEANWGAVQMTPEEFDALASELKMIAEQDLVLLAEVAGETVGFALALPDINQALIHNRMGSLPGALWQLLTRRRKIRRGRILVLGVLPGYRRRGIDAALYYDIGRRMTEDHPYTEAEASWVLESNEMMNRAARMMKGEIYKTYRIYRKSIKEN